MGCVWRTSKFSPGALSGMEAEATGADMILVDVERDRVVGLKCEVERALMLRVDKDLITLKDDTRYLRTQMESMNVAKESPMFAFLTLRFIMAER